MHLEPSHHAPGTRQEFLRQYAMIVLSILTALGLERVAVGLHDRAAARESRFQIEAELARDAADLAVSEQVNRASIKQTKTALRALIAQLKAPQPGPMKPDASIAPLLTGFSISTPSWQRQAWDTAVSDQSASHLDAGDLNRYRVIYASERDLNELAQLLLGGEWLTQSVNVELDAQLGRYDVRQIAGVLARYLLVVEQVEAGEEKLSGLLTATGPTSASAGSPR